MIPRIIRSEILEDIANSRKIIMLYGARQVGKTTLIKDILKQLPLKILEVNADHLKYNEIFSSRDLSKMEELIDDNELIFIDEAQNIPNIGINLKILHDSLPQLKIITTGSSSFEPANKIREPLTGRTRTYHLFPVSLGELRQIHSPFELKEKLPYYMSYGMYPEVLQIKGRQAKIDHLHELASSYLYRDILKLSNIKHSDKIYKLLKLLAYQIGSLVSLHELGNSLQMSHGTVSNYIDLLEKGFIIFPLSGFSGNLRKEVTKMNKIYFYDLGIRNVLTGNFNAPESRQEIGRLWENFLMAERFKKMSYKRIYANKYFWRTYSGAELNYVEETGGKLYGYEFKWGTKKGRVSKTWMETYNNASYQLINRDNFLEFVL